MPFLAAANAWLVSIHPVAPWALLTLGVFLSVYASRKLLPKLWVWFDSVTPDGMMAHVIQGLPAVGLGAIIGVIADGGDFGLAWKGAIAGALAPVLHLVLKMLPVPYQGAVTKIVTKAGLLGIVLICVGCSRFAHFSDPSIDDRVTDICSLLATQNTALLEAEAKRQGIDATSIKDTFATACALRVKRGLEPAKRAGLAAARRQDESDAGTP